MALSEEENATLRRLSAALTKSTRDLERLDAYYEGFHRLERLGLAVPPELDRFVTTVNWPRITVDSVEQRCDIEGFRLLGADEANEDLWTVWQANDLDEESQQAHLDSLIFGRSYVCVGARGPEDERAADMVGDVPLVTVESPFEMIHETDPRTRRVTAALRRTNTATGASAKFATLYLPDVTIWLEHQGARGWVEQDRDEHQIGWPLVIPMINRPRLRRREGVSEMADVLNLSDAACRALTNVQVATEVLAVPQRYVIGASPQDFVDQDGKPVPAWETYFGAVWALRSEKATVGQFSAADLSNFERIVNHYANLVSGVSGLPTRFYGQYTTNPPSEGSIVADETRLIMNSYRKHRGFGGTWERSMRLVRRIQDGEWNPDLARMETLWKDPETPTRAQTADATVKLVQANILPVEAAWEELGYSATRRQQLKQLRDDAAAADPLTKAAAAFQNSPAAAAAGESAPAPAA